MQGLDISDKGLDLVSNVIRKLLNIECAVLMGANIASEVAKEDFCEATIGEAVCACFTPNLLRPCVLPNVLCYEITVKPVERREKN